MQKLEKDPFTLEQETEFLAWIRTLPSSLSGKTIDIQACHVRRVAQGAGTARKPRLFAIPMTSEEHSYQHNQGELGCLIKYNTYWGHWRGYVAFPERLRLQAKCWFEEKAFLYRKEFLENIWNKK